MWEVIAASVSLLGTLVFGLFSWGGRSEIRASRAEVRAELAQAEVRFFELVNGKYVRKELHGELSARVDRIESRVEDLE